MVQTRGFQLRERVSDRTLDPRLFVTGPSALGSILGGGIQGVDEGLQRKQQQKNLSEQLGIEKSREERLQEKFDMEQALLGEQRLAEQEAATQRKLEEQAFQSNINEVMSTPEGELEGANKGLRNSLDAFLESRGRLPKNFNEMAEFDFRPDEPEEERQKPKISVLNAGDKGSLLVDENNNFEVINPKDIVMDEEAETQDGMQLFNVRDQKTGEIVEGIRMDDDGNVLVFDEEQKRVLGKVPTQDLSPQEAEEIERSRARGRILGQLDVEVSDIEDMVEAGDVEGALKSFREMISGLQGKQESSRLTEEDSDPMSELNDLFGDIVPETTQGDTGDRFTPDEAASSALDRLGL